MAFILFCNLIKNINILENKKTDGITAQIKNEKWKEIVNSLNSQGIGPSWDYLNLRTAWENLKKAARKCSADSKMETLKTGGGSYKIKTDPILERVMELIRPTVEGMINPFDGDSETRDTNIVAEEQVFVLTEGSTDIEGDVHVPASLLDWGKYTTQMLKSPVHPALQPTGEKNINNECMETASDVAYTETCTVSATTTAAASTSSNTSTPSWAKRRRPVLSKLEESKAEVHKLKAEGIRKSTKHSTQEHLWEQELHSLRLEQEKIRLEIEKVRLEREKEILKQEVIKTEKLLSEN